ncbi:MAG: hypothetical protein WAU47_14095 [Desulfobaccales bacterium]
MATAICPAAANAAGLGSYTWRSWPPTFTVVAAPSSLEAQMFGERLPFSPTLASLPSFQDLCPGSDGGQVESVLALPKNFRISFRYNRDNPVGHTEALTQSPVLFKYSMDYCFSSKLKVGLSGFLYQPPADNISFLRERNDLVMGWGPSLKYDLGRWGFTFQSQVDKFRSEEEKDIKGWFRVWYAF